jgi:hypothetical protein
MSHIQVLILILALIGFLLFAIESYIEGTPIQNIFALVCSGAVFGYLLKEVL